MQQLLACRNVSRCPCSWHAARLPCMEASCAFERPQRRKRSASLIMSIAPLPCILSTHAPVLQTRG
eukprot:365979-Chlamydomonas_euryale.AAC.3